MAAEPGMDYWFTETFTLGDLVLPAGVVIRTSDPAAQPRGTLTLENQTDTLLFVLSLRYKDVLVMVTPDPNWKARVDGANEVASYTVAPNHPVYLVMEALTDLDPKLVDRNVLSFDSPPTDLSIPGAQSSELLLVYAEQVIEVPFTLTYARNPNFNHASEAYLPYITNTRATSASVTTAQPAEGSASQMARTIPWIGGLVGVAVLLSAGWLVWNGLAHRKKDL
jgi:hypothetical protein